MIQQVIEDLYKLTDGFMQEGYTTSQSEGQTVVYSVCAAHKVTAYDLAYYTDSELYKHYDNYGVKQIDEMVATGKFPLKLTSLWIAGDGSETIGIETDIDGNLMSLSEAIEMFQNEMVTTINKNREM